MSNWDVSQWIAAALLAAFLVFAALLPTLVRWWRSVRRAKLLIVRGERAKKEAIARWGRVDGSHPS